MEKELKKIFNTINEKLDNTFSPNGKKIFIALICIAIIAIIFLAVTSCKKTEETQMAELPSLENTVNVPSDDEDMTTVEIDDIDQSESKMVSLSVEDYGRSNPFLPSSESYTDVTKYGFELMAPPGALSDGSEASKVVSTKVSGIMYDSKSPSAILNIEGSDYLVRSGDYINNYRVLAIGKDLVTVQLGANVYKARVGEVLADGEYNENNVYKLENKFGGARR